MRIALQKAFVLHHRAYRETSLLLDLYTLDYGRIGAIARGVRQSRSKLKSLLQPFVPLWISWQGKSELVTLTAIEGNGLAYHLKKDSLLSGLYLNELLMRALHKFDPNPQLYTIYQETLIELQSTTLPQKILRLFEKNLLEQLGYGVQLNHDVHAENFSAEQYYRFHLEQGFELCEASQHNSIFSGKSLLAFANEQLDDEISLRDAKRLMRLALAPIIGNNPLQSRRLYTRIENHVQPKLEIETE